MVHRALPGALYDSFYAAKSLQDYVKPWNIPWLDTYDAGATNSRISCVKNPLMVGTSGTLNDVTNAGVANDVAIYTSAGVVATPSKIIRTDGAPGYWQQIVFNTSGGANGGIQNFQLKNNAGLGEKVVGDYIETFMEFEIDKVGLSALKGIQMRIYFYGATTERSYEFMDYLDINIDSPDQSVLKGVFSTPRRTIPSGVTGWNIGIDLVLKTPGDNVTLRVGRVTYI